MKKISLVGLMLFVGLLGTLNAQNNEKYQALFIYNFTRYIEWPSNGSSEFVIGVIGRSNIYNELIAVADGRKVGTQTITVKKFTSASEVSSCQILFISGDASAQVSSLSPALSGKNTLIITERSGLISKGAGINFVINDGKQKFQLSKVNLQKSGLKVNAQLVDMAVLVD
jgi:hypothetical protein